MSLGHLLDLNEREIEALRDLVKFPHHELVDLAMRSQEFFTYFLVGYMYEYRDKMNEAARSYLEAHNPKLLEEAEKIIHLHGDK